MNPSWDDSWNNMWVPDDFCGICGEHSPDGPHCSPKCAAESAAILAKAKGVA